MKETPIEEVEKDLKIQIYIDNIRLFNKAHNKNKSSAIEFILDELDDLLDIK